MVTEVGRWRSQHPVHRRLLDQAWPAIAPVGITDSFAFYGNHVRDLLHVVVPSAHSDFLSIDAHWAAQLREVQTNLGLDRPWIHT